MVDGQTLIRARASVAGLRPGQVDWRPTERADELIAGGYAVKVETLAERQASEPPNRHLDRQPSNQTGGTLGPDANPFPDAPAAIDEDRLIHGPLGLLDPVGEP
jgi:hypothetical protein